MCSTWVTLEEWIPEETRYMKETLFTVNLFNNIIVIERDLKIGIQNFHQGSYMLSKRNEVVFVCDNKGLYCRWCNAA